MKQSLTILKKELLEIFRDRSTILILLIPILIFPAFNIGMNYINKDSVKRLDICISYDSYEAYEIFNRYISATESYDINVITSKTPKSLLTDGKIDCLICINNSAFDFIYNSNSFDSLSLTAKLGEDFQKFYNACLNQSYEGIYQMNLKDENNNISDPAKTVSDIFVPIALVMMIFQNTSSFANDIFAGEKDRKTAELLLLTGVKRRYIYFGKLLALFVMSSINLAGSLLSCLISFNFSQDGLTEAKFMQKGISSNNILVIFLITLLLSLIAAVVSLTVSMISKNMKNAQVMNEIILAVPTVMTALITLGIIKSSLPLLNYIPLLNLSLGLNNAFGGTVSVYNILISLITNGFLIGVITALGIRYIKTERILR